MEFRIIMNKKRVWCFNLGLLLIILALMLCSCRKRSTITFYMGPSNTQDTSDELTVKDGKYQETLNYCQEMLKKVQPDSVEQADVFRAMGNVYAQYMNDKDNAEYYINKAIEIDQKEGRDIDLAKDYCAMSAIYDQTGVDIEKGLQYLDKAEQIYKKYGDNSFGLAEVFMDKGRLYQNGGQLDKALKMFKNARQIYDNRNEQDDILCILTGQVYLEQKDYKNAEEQYLEAQKICESNNDLYGNAVVQDQLGWLYNCIEEYDKSIDCYKQALEFYLGDKAYLIKAAATYNNMSCCYDDMHKVKSALQVSIKACQIIQNTTPKTSAIDEKGKLYKHNLSMDYKSLTGDMTEEGYEKWYTDVVINGKDWKDTVVNESKSSETTDRKDDSET